MRGKDATKFTFLFSLKLLSFFHDEYPTTVELKLKQSGEASNRASKFTIDEDLEWLKVWRNGCSAASAAALLWAFLITFETNIKIYRFSVQRFEKFSVLFFHQYESDFI